MKKLWRKFNGKKYQLWYKTNSVNVKEIFVKSLKPKFFVRVLKIKDGWQIYRRKR
jgi:hypothetical protein